MVSYIVIMSMDRNHNDRRLSTAKLFTLINMLCSIRTSLGFSRTININVIKNSNPLVLVRPLRHTANDANQLTMDNIYREWTIHDDEILYNNQHLSTVKLASLLGRGLHGVESRMKKISDVNSSAYSRLFGVTKLIEEESKSKGLTPVKEILRRIQWDPTLDASLFTVVHYDRMDDSLCEEYFVSHFTIFPMKCSSHRT